MARKTPVRLGVTLNLMCSAPQTSVKEFVIKTKRVPIDIVWVKRNIGYRETDLQTQQSVLVDGG